MKTSIRNVIFTGVWFLICTTSNFLSAQCSGCSTIISVSSSTNMNVNTANTKICITGGTYSGSIKLNKANTTLCIGPGATFTGTVQMNSSSCSVTNYGTWNTSSTTVNKGVFTNEGSFTTGNLKTNSNGTLVLNGSSFSTTGNITVNGIMVVNQPAQIGGNLKVNGGATASFNDQLTVNGNIVNNNSLELYGTTNVSGNVVNNGGGQLSIDGGILSISGNFTNYGTAVGSSNDCGGVSVGGSSINTGNYGTDGSTLDICDNGAGFDLQYGTIGPNVANCACTPGMPLPIELLEFKVKPSTNGVELSWTTASEINNHYFSIERSYDGIAIETIGMVTGSGSTNTPISYSHNDEEQLSTTVYYRLRQTDFNGTSTSFEWHAVNSKSIQSEEVAFQVGPNPVNNGQVWIGCENCDQEVANIELFDLNGQSIQTFPPLALNRSEMQQLSLDGNLAAGYYLMRVNTSTSSWMQKLMVK